MSMEPDKNCTGYKAAYENLFGPSESYRFITALSLSLSLFKLLTISQTLVSVY